MERIYSIDEIKAIVTPIAASYEVERIYLFGSYARGELYADLEDGLGKQLDLLTTGSLDKDFLNRIAKEEVLIYGS